MEKNNAEHAKMEITEAAALHPILPSKYNLDLENSINGIYSRKLENMKSAHKA